VRSCTYRTRLLKLRQDGLLLVAVLRPTFSDRGYSCSQWQKLHGQACNAAPKATSRDARLPWGRLFRNQVSSTAMQALCGRIRKSASGRLARTHRDVIGRFRVGGRRRPASRSCESGSYTAGSAENVRAIALAGMSGSRTCSVRWSAIRLLFCQFSDIEANPVPGWRRHRCVDCDRPTECGSGYAQCGQDAYI